MKTIIIIAAFLATVLAQCSPSCGSGTYCYNGQCCTPDGSNGIYCPPGLPPGKIVFSGDKTKCLRADTATNKAVLASCTSVSPSMVWSYLSTYMLQLNGSNLCLEFNSGANRMDLTTCSNTDPDQKVYHNNGLNCPGFPTFSDASEDKCMQGLTSTNTVQITYCNSFLNCFDDRGIWWQNELLEN